MSTPDIEGPAGCRKADLPKVIALVDDALRQGIDQTLLMDYPLVYLERNLENVRILKVDGKMVCAVPYIPHDAAIDDCRFSVGIISPTATAPEHRRKGYGSRCLNSCIEKMTREEIDLSVLWTLAPTFPFYEKANYQAVRFQNWVYRLNRDDAGLFDDGGEEVVEYDPASGQYIGDIQAMHEQEVPGVVRLTDEYPVLFNLPGVKTLVVLKDGRPCAYLAVGRAVNKPGLVEAGGEKAAIETLVNHALMELDGDSHFDAYSYLTPTLLGSLLDEKIPGRKQPQGHGFMMVRVNGFHRFMEKISGWLEKKNGDRAGKFSIGITDLNEIINFEFSESGLGIGTDRFSPHFEFSSRELISVIFGPHPERPVEIPDQLNDLFPFYFPIYLLDHS